jgi:hypothetical protein
MQYLVARLTLGATDNCLRTHVLQHGDILYAADRAVLEKRVSLMVEAGAEGCVTIVRGLIEESTRAHICCMEDLFGLRAGRPATLQRFLPGCFPALCGPRQLQRNGMTSGGMPITTDGWGV